MLEILVTVHTVSHRSISWSLWWITPLSWAYCWPPKGTPPLFLGFLKFPWFYLQSIWECPYWEQILHSAVGLAILVCPQLHTRFMCPRPLHEKHDRGLLTWISLSLGTLLCTESNKSNLEHKLLNRFLQRIYPTYPPVVWAPATLIVFDPSCTGLDLYPNASPILVAAIADVMSELPALTKDASWLGKPCLTLTTVPGQISTVSFPFRVPGYNSHRVVDVVTVLSSQTVLSQQVELVCSPHNNSVRKLPPNCPHRPYRLHCGSCSTY